MIATAINQKKLIQQLRNAFDNANLKEIDQVINNLTDKIIFSSLCNLLFEKCSVDGKGSIVADGFFKDVTTNSSLCYAMYTLLGYAPNSVLLKHQITRIKISKIDKKQFCLPQNLYKFKQLKILITRGMKLESVPSNLFKCKNLKIIDLSENKFNHIPQQILDLQEIEALNMSFNQIQKIPDELANMKKLKILLLKGNQISDSSVDWKQIKNLRDLDLSMNRIEHIPESLGENLSLRKLRVMFNNLPAHMEAYWQNRIFNNEQNRGLQGSLDFNIY